MAKRRTIAGVVLAAGQSSRARPANKLLAPVGGAPMVRRVAETALAAGLDPVVVVTGFEAERVAAALAGLAVAFVHNPDYGQGMGGSIGRGMAALSAEVASVTAAAILLGDMPDVKASTVALLTAAFDPAKGRTICVPVIGGKRGNPVLFGRLHFAALGAIAGDRGGKAIVDAHPGAVAEVEVDDAGVLADYDTLGDGSGVSGGR